MHVVGVKKQIRRDAVLTGEDLVVAAILLDLPEEYINMKAIEMQLKSQGRIKGNMRCWDGWGNGGSGPGHVTSCVVEGIPGSFTDLPD